jgi:uncharacterized protein (TIGR03118 family)
VGYRGRSGLLDQCRGYRLGLCGSSHWHNCVQGHYPCRIWHRHRLTRRRVLTGAATGFVLPNGAKASFLFSTLDGTISGWNGKLGTAGIFAQITINNSAANAKYTDLAMLTNANSSYILAADFGKSTAVEVYDNTFKPAKLPGSFTDPNLPANYAPFAVHVLGTQVFVTYALRTSTTPPTYDEVVGPGNGLVDVFDTPGNFVTRAITGGNLNAPWGVAIAPTAFGIYRGDLLVGNFGDGIINAYDPTTYAYRGQVIDGAGKSFSYVSLWEIFFGRSPAGAGDVNTLYFAAGLTDEAHGLFGAISNNTAAGGTPTFGFSASASASTVTDGSSTQAIVSVAPTNNFSGTVSLACSGLPKGATCTFSPTQITASASASATSTVTIQTTKKSSALVLPGTLRGTYAAGITAALLLPFGSLLAFSRRQSSGKQSHIRLLGLLSLLLVSTAIVLGCGHSKPVTPPGMSQVTITATSGSITQKTVIALTVQ